MVAVASALAPSVRLSAAQPWSVVMRNTYGILPTLGLGISMPRSEHLALNMELAGTYARSLGDGSATSLWSTSLRAGLEASARRSTGLYATPGLMVTYASEQFPGYDSMTGVIRHRNYAGASLGAFLNAGVRLIRFGDWSLGLESGLDLVSVPTNLPYPGSDYYWSYNNRYWLNISTLNLGLVLHRDSRKFEEK
jgi:hypothetical protein